MRLHDDGRSAFVTVQYEPQDVATFAAQWPCFDGPENGASFTFQRSTGDLVDMEPADWDGSAALAMSEDAWAWYEEHPGPDAPCPADWDRFDICEAWSLLAHDFGLYGITDRLACMGFRARPNLPEVGTSSGAYTFQYAPGRITRFARASRG